MRKKKDKPEGNATPRTVAPDMFTHLVGEALGVQCVREYKFHPVRRWRFDYAIPALRIAVEVEGGVWNGGRHVSGAGFMRDMEKYNTATSMGWRILRTTPQHLYDAETMDAVTRTAKAVRDAFPGDRGKVGKSEGL